MEKLEPAKYNLVISLMRETYCDFAHGLRVLKETDWNHDKSKTQVLQELEDFKNGKITLDENKNVVTRAIKREV